MVDGFFQSFDDLLGGFEDPRGAHLIYTFVSNRASRERPPL